MIRMQIEKCVYILICKSITIINNFNTLYCTGVII